MSFCYSLTIKLTDIESDYISTVYFLDTNIFENIESGKKKKKRPSSQKDFCACFWYRFFLFLWLTVSFWTSWTSLCFQYHYSRFYHFSTFKIRHFKSLPSFSK